MVYGNNAHGGHAKYLKVPAFTLVPLLDELSFATGAAISCGTGTAYGALAPHPALGQRHDRDLRPGAGRAVGDAAAPRRWARASSRSMSARSGSNRAKEFGADETVNPRSNDPGRRDQGSDARLRRRVHARHVDRSRRAASRAVRATKVWGTTCFVGERNQVTIDVSPDMLRKQLTIVASWTFSQMGQAECAQFIADRKIDVEKLFTHRWQLDQADEAYKLFDTQTTGKGVFLM